MFVSRNRLCFAEYAKESQNMDEYISRYKRRYLEQELGARGGSNGENVGFLSVVAGGCDAATFQVESRLSSPSLTLFLVTLVLQAIN